MTWVEGRCLSYGSAIPYQLVLDLLRSNCGIAETDTPETIADKLRSGLLEVGMDPDEDAPVLFHLLEIKDAAASPALSNPEAVKNRAFETLRRLAINGSQQRPLVLVLEDLHWVDKVSEEFLGYSRGIRDARSFCRDLPPGLPAAVDRQILCGTDAATAVVPRRQPPDGSLGAPRRASCRSRDPRNRRQGRRQSVSFSSSWRCTPAKQGSSIGPDGAEHDPRGRDGAIDRLPEQTKRLLQMRQ